MSEPVRVVLVDDHRLFRDGLRQLLNSDERFRVIGEASSGEEFMELLVNMNLMQAGGTTVANRPWPLPASQDACTALGDVRNPVDEMPLVFMDIDMPGIGGVEATRLALERWPDLKVIALSMHGEQEFYFPMVEAGAKGFLLKNSEFAEVAAAAQRVVAGSTYFSQELMPALVEAMNRAADAVPEGEHWREPLSERETEVLPLVCEGLSNHQIADRLFISKRTVDKHRANILAKTGCKNTASLVIYAVKNNLIKI